MHITPAYACCFKTSGSRVRVLARTEGVGVAAGTLLVVHPDPCRSTHRRGSVRGHEDDRLCARLAMGFTAENTRAP